MKKTIILLIAGTVLLPGVAGAGGSGRNTATEAALGTNTVSVVTAEPKPAPVLTRFDLSFSGGTPRDLVQAIQEGIKMPLNAIIPEEHANMRLPALRMKNVTVPELFDALIRASEKRVNVVTGTYFSGGNASPSSQYQATTLTYGFRTSEGRPRDETIWYFYCNKPATPPDQPGGGDAVCRYYQLAPYLESYKIEDITTAIKTGWKMLRDPENPDPEISFHKETKLLIAVGSPAKLQLIDSVLTQLRPNTNTGKSAGKPEPTPTAPAKSGEPDQP